jgi:hypothetical protein
MTAASVVVTDTPVMDDRSVGRRDGYAGGDDTRVGDG